MTDKELQADLDDAQADLEKKVGQLKHVLQAKVESVEKPFQWAFDHLPQILIGTGLAIVAISLLRSKTRVPAMPSNWQGQGGAGPFTRGAAQLDRAAVALRELLANRQA